jgi:REP element-mobilizing transposase RayT
VFAATQEVRNRFNGFWNIMSTHAYSRCWLHLIWGTLKREGMFEPAQAAKVSGFLTDYARKNGIFMKINFVNTDHVHALIDLPTGTTIEQVVKLLKGASSHWVNEQDLVAGKFAWGRGYGAFSVSQSGVDEVCAYIAGQAEHHRGKSFAEEYARFVKVYGLEWRDEETVETVSSHLTAPKPLVKTRGQ